MRELAMLPERLAVVADDDEHRLVLVERLDEPTDLVVEVRDLTVVGATGLTLRERLRREVREVGVVQVHPNEQRAIGRLGLLPREGVVDDVGPGALRVPEVARPDVDVVKVGVKALVETPATGGYERSDAAGGSVARGLHALRQRGLRGFELARPVAPDPEGRRIAPGEQRRVGGDRQRER